MELILTMLLVPLFAAKMHFVQTAPRSALTVAERLDRPAGAPTNEFVLASTKE